MIILWVIAPIVVTVVVSFAIIKFKARIPKTVENLKVTVNDGSTVFLHNTNTYKIRVGGVDYVTCDNIKCNLIWPVGHFELCPGCRRPL